MRVVVAVHDPPVWTLPDAQVRRIARAAPGVEVVDARDPARRREALATADVLFGTRLSAAEFAGAPRLRWVHTSAVGVGGLLTPELIESRVIVTNSRGIHSDAIAEHAIALVLALRRGLHVAAARQAEGRWAQEEISRRAVPPLAGSRLLVVGLGSIGRRVAAMAAALGMRVTGIRRTGGEPPPPDVERVLPLAGLHEALPDADAVVLALPRTPETAAAIGPAELAAMKPGAILVNVARGRLVDEAALLAALESGRISAGLDAFAREPLAPDHPFWRLPNVLVTPHTAAFTGDYWGPVVDLFLANLARFRRGEPLENVVDPRRGY